jgi:hypothetical protein
LRGGDRLHKERDRFDVERGSLREERVRNEFGAGAFAINGSKTKGEGRKPRKWNVHIWIE